MKTKETIRAYNKEYSARPKVIEWAKIRNAKPERKIVRKAYKQTEAAKRANSKYRNKPEVLERVRRRRLEILYGISYEEHEMLKIGQNNKCLICFKVADLHVDHNHKTGKVRGLLCGSCNRALGLLKEDITLFEEAIKYLKNHV